jgi:hypothetical protein
MQNFASGTQVSPHLVDDVRLNAHLDLGAADNVDGELIDGVTEKKRKIG